jgi:hypothetical protein
MTSPAEFPSTTRHLGLPLLFAGQAQKEFFINHAFGIIDSVARRSIKASLASPPQTALDGEYYRIVAPAVGEWQGKDDQLALRIGGAWHYVAPAIGSMTYDETLGQCLHFDGAWRSATLPAAANGGTAIDIEARALLAQVIDALAKLGLVARQPA